MIIKKILNNNVVISENDRSEEIVIMGKGLAFQKKNGDAIESEKIDKIFVSGSASGVREIEKMVLTVDPVIIDIAKEIILYAEKNMNQEYSDQAYITLTDHLNYAVARGKEGIFIPNPLLFEIRKFYPEEYKIAVRAIDEINQKLETNFPIDEAGFIALHLANSRKNGNKLPVTMESTEMVRDILNIISRFFGMMFDESSLNYNRMVTHIQYFVKRILEKKTVEETDDFLYELVQSKYPEAFSCSLRIRDYLLKTKNVEIKEPEMIYLVIHINRVVEDTKK
ncbi:BglG family transcription antiterminator LicT [Vagococcus fluvialis]|uniref:BglG family transcription antiterminator LicT n=1 Tax=Vagococcus fluvialis TaxID=2738 RepID=UPI00288F5611|nr:PRD domain-containing protein [Vagococcus fluvialis]MDT2747411.1 PRD domain-containing protein [Vagococcus fluvialis]